MITCRWVAALASFLALGCECGGARPSHAGLAPAGEAPSSPPSAELVLATTRMTATTPALVVEVRADGVRISTVSWVQSWPDSQRAALRAGHPDGIEIDEELSAPEASALSHRPTYEVLSRARALDAERATGGPISGAFALRVHHDATWGSVLAVLFSAAQVGYVEPRFVYRRDAGEVWLPIPLAHEAPGVRPSSEREALATAVAAALAGPEGAPAPSSPSRSEPLRVRLGTDAVQVTSGAAAVGPGCVLGGAESVLPNDLPASTLADCVGSLRGERRVELAADRSLAWSRVAPALEALAGRFPIELSASLR